MDDVLAEHISQHTHELIGPCAAVYHNRLGGRVVSLAYTPWAFTQSLAKRHQWRNLVAWLAGGTPTAWVLESYRVVPFVRSDGQRWVVLLINASMDTTTPLHVQVAPAASTARLFVHNEDDVELPVTHQGAASLIEVPAMAPWSFHLLSAE